MLPLSSKRIAWVLTGSGHFLKECLELASSLPNVDLFLSKAAAEVLKQYGYSHSIERVYLDKTASAVPVEFFYQGVYGAVVVAPATSNSIAKMAFGISDTLATNVFAQAGKCRVPCIVFACDTSPELESEAPRDNTVKVYPRKIDLDNVATLATFESTFVVSSIPDLALALNKCLSSVE